MFESLIPIIFPFPPSFLPFCRNFLPLLKLLILPYAGSRIQLSTCPTPPPLEKKQNKGHWVSRRMSLICSASLGLLPFCCLGKQYCSTTVVQIMIFKLQSEILVGCQPVNHGLFGCLHSDLATSLEFNQARFIVVCWSHYMCLQV